MANDHSATAGDSGMDMPAHEASYVGFIEVMQTVIAVILSIVLMLVLWGLEGHGFLALIAFVLTSAAAAIGALTGLGWKAVAPMFVLLALACIVL